jgi:hypothetical protein
VVNAYNFPMEKRTVGVAFLDECRTTMVGFNYASLNHCPKEAKKATDQLASSVQNPNCNVWLESPPFFLYLQLVDDVTIL